MTELKFAVVVDVLTTHQGHAFASQLQCGRYPSYTGWNYMTDQKPNLTNAPNVEPRRGIFRRIVNHMFGRYRPWLRSPKKNNLPRVSLFVIWFGAFGEWKHAFNHRLASQHYFCSQGRGHRSLKKTDCRLEFTVVVFVSQQFYDQTSWISISCKNMFDTRAYPEYSLQTKNFNTWDLCIYFCYCKINHAKGNFSYKWSLKLKNNPKIVVENPMCWNPYGMFYQNILITSSSIWFMSWFLENSAHGFFW